MKRSIAITKLAALEASFVPRSRQSWMSWLLACYKRVRERRALAALDERMLRDIGITRADVAMEIEKLPWQK